MKKQKDASTVTVTETYEETSFVIHGDPEQVTTLSEAIERTMNPNMATLLDAIDDTQAGKKVYYRCECGKYSKAESGVCMPNGTEKLSDAEYAKYFEDRYGFPYEG